MAFTFTRIANTNTSIPNREETFDGFSFFDTDLLWPTINDRGDVAFYGRGILEENNPSIAGIYIYTDSLQFVVDTNTPIPNDPFPSDNTDSFLGFTPPFLNNNGELAFRSLIAIDPSVQGLESLKIGIYKTVGGLNTLNTVADPNTLIPGSTETFQALSPFISFNENGNVVFVGSNNDGSIFFPETQGGIYIDTDTTGLTPAVELNDPIPNQTEIFDFFLFPDINNNGTVVFDGRKENRSSNGIYKSEGGVLTTIVDNNTPVPNSTGTFSNASYPRLNQNGNVAFFGSQFSDNNTLTNIGVYTDIGGINLVADTNTPIPNGVGNFITFASDAESTPTDSFPSDLLSLDDNGVVAFVGVGSEEQQGIYTNLNGELETVIDLNTPLEGKIIQDLAFGPEGLSGNQIAFSALFTDGTEGIYVANFAPVSLSLTVDTESISEADGEDAATVTVTRTGGTAASLDVTLTSSDPTEATVPLTVTIPVDQTTATFSLNAVDDLIDDGDRTVTLTASAEGFTEETAEITVVDDVSVPTPPPEGIFTFTRIVNTNISIPNREETFDGFSFFDTDLLWPTINDRGDVAFYGRGILEKNSTSISPSIAGIYIHTDSLQFIVDTNRPVPNDPFPNNNIIQIIFGVLLYLFLTRIES
ncbi:MAG: choice-of-anchor tandem repeat NxxGxxAF-containing protein [Lyngbya sp.]|nr:choice-of-anchor tandem repeat NxxGxxAF-containing protein [Lyngbya sp.]